MRESNTIHFKPELYCGLKNCCHIHTCYIIFRLPFVQSESLKSHVNMIYTLLFEPKKKKKRLGLLCYWMKWITVCFTLYLCFNCCFDTSSKMHTICWKGYWWFVESSITFLMLCCSHSFCWSNSFSFSSRSSISDSRYLSLSITSFVLQPAPTPLKKV